MAELSAKERKAMFAKDKRNPNTIPESVLFAIISSSDDIPQEVRHSIWARTIDLRDKRLEAFTFTLRSQMISFASGFGFSSVSTKNPDASSISPPSIPENVEKPITSAIMKNPKMKRLVMMPIMKQPVQFHF